MSGWTAAQTIAHFRRMGVPDPVPIVCGEPRRSKYRAVPTFVGGIRFASKAEARTYQSLVIARDAGLISDLVLQPRYELQGKFTEANGTRHRAVAYVGDFAFTRDGKRYCVDSKCGVEAAGFRTKFKMAIKKYPDIIFEVWKQ